MDSQVKTMVIKAESNDHPDSPVENLYTYQIQVMPVLLGWATGSATAGLIWMRGASKFWRGLGSQFLGWGAIDGLIAGFALRGAAKSALKLEHGEISPAEHQRQWLQFERFVWLNVLLDIGYITGGAWLRRRNPQDQFRQGMGWGIILQGGFLLIWDILLATVSRSKRRGN